MTHGESIEVCAGIIYKGADIIRKKHLSEDEIHEQQHKLNCNFIRKESAPVCGNCMYSAYDPETGKTYCLVSIRRSKQ